MDSPTTPEPDGWRVRLGEGPKLAAGNHWLQVLVHGDRLEGALGAWLHVHREITHMDAHAHANYDKVALVLDGSYQFTVGSEAMEAKTGDLVVIPRSAFHSFTTPGGSLLFVCAPAGNEQYFLEAAELGTGSIADLDARHGMLRRAGDHGLKVETC